MIDYNERLKQSHQGMFYSLQRIDLLIISICGAGIYVCFETLKYLTENDIEVSGVVKLASIFFVLGIILNFFSQIYGYSANEKDYLWCTTNLELQTKANNDKLFNKEPLLALIKTYDDESEKYSKKTKNLNLFSIFTMFLGLITIIVYFTCLF